MSVLTLVLCARLSRLLVTFKVHIKLLHVIIIIITIIIIICAVERAVSIRHSGDASAVKVKESSSQVTRSQGRSQDLPQKVDDLFLVVALKTQAANDADRLLFYCQNKTK